MTYSIVVSDLTCTKVHLSVNAYGSLKQTRRDLASVRASVEECHAENIEFFERFMGSIEATQQGIDVLRVSNEYNPDLSRSSVVQRCCCSLKCAQNTMIDALVSSVSLLWVMFSVSRYRPFLPDM